MALKIVEVKEMPDYASPSTKGFRIIDGDDVMMFFHWSPNEVEHETKYEDILKALPDRLASMGYEEQIDAVLGEVVGRYGS